MPAKISGVNPLLLHSCIHLADIGTHDLVRLAEAAECRYVAPETVLFQQGDAAGEVFILVEGVIHLERLDDERKLLSHETTAPYATFGDITLLDEPYRRYTATAAARCVVVALPAVLLRKVLAAHSAVTIAWRGAIIARLHRKESLPESGIAWKILGKISMLMDAA